MNTFWVHKNWQWRKENATAKYIDQHCEEAVTLADAQATVEALQADNRTYINERHENMKQIESLQSHLSQLQALVRAVYQDLPTKRDWLDPVLEARMKATLDATTPAAKGGDGE